MWKHLSRAEFAAERDATTDALEALEATEQALRAITEHSYLPLYVHGLLFLCRLISFELIVCFVFIFRSQLDSWSSTFV